MGAMLSDAQRIDRLAARTPYLGDEEVWRVDQRQRQRQAATARELLVGILVAEVILLAVLAAAWAAAGHDLPLIGARNTWSGASPVSGCGEGAEPRVYGGPRPRRYDRGISSTAVWDRLGTRSGGPGHTGHAGSVRPEHRLPIHPPQSGRDQ